jgi:phenylacetate-CoA ligase
MEDFRRLPVLTKDDLRGHAEEIVREDADRADLVRGATGGSTGVPTPYYHDTAWWLRASAAALRGDEWTGWRLGERHANLWGTPLAESPKARLVRVLGERARNQLFLPSFDLSPRVLDGHVDALLRWSPRLVTGYASVLEAFARRMEERGIALSGTGAVVSSADALTPPMRARISAAFGAPVFDRYGCRELGIVAQECHLHDGLHLAAEHVYVEVDAGGRPARPGETGRLLLTLLPPASFPFVRYEVGDAAVAGNGEPCPCGLPSLRLARIEGRLVDVLRRADGSAFTGLFFPHLMKEYAWVEGFQVVQDERGDLEIRVVLRGAAPSAPEQESVVRHTRNAIGEGLGIRLSFVGELEKTPSGKVRITRCLWKGPSARVPVEVRS